MTKHQKQFFSWRLKLILACGGVLALALGIFSYHVDRMNDFSNGTIPLSWSFKAKERSVAGYFQTPKSTLTRMPSAKRPMAAIDREHPKETEFAIFALG